MTQFHMILFYFFGICGNFEIYGSVSLWIMSRSYLPLYVFQEISILIQRLEVYTFIEMDWGIKFRKNPARDYKNYIESMISTSKCIIYRSWLRYYHLNNIRKTCGSFTFTMDDLQEFTWEVAENLVSMLASTSRKQRLLFFFCPSNLKWEPLIVRSWLVRKSHIIQRRM